MALFQFDIGASACRLSAGTIFAALALAPHQAKAQNLIQNPGFEQSTVDIGPGSADSSPFWMVETGQGTSFIADSQNHTGEWSAMFAANGITAATGASLMQSFDTAPNTSYMVSFFLSSTAAVGANQMIVTFDGATIFSLINISPSEYQNYSMLVTTPNVTTPDGTLPSLLTFMGDAGPSGNFRLDDVSVMEVEGAPAPVTGGGIASFVVVIAGLAIRRVRRTGLRAT